MNITIADAIVIRTGLTEAEILLSTAIELFRDNRVTLVQASQIAGLHQSQFQKELARRKIPIHYDIDDFEADMQTLSRLK